jgi:PAS domain-containing protein
MNELHSLTVRTTAALGRLAELQRRAERVNSNAGPVVRPALKELSFALEELQVANEQLEESVQQLGSSQVRVEEVAAQLAEFVNVLPVACIWTNPGGVIDEANQSAATLLNVARQRLSGKPLMLFIGDRPPFFDALTALKGSPDACVELSVTVRPRERRPRVMRLIGRRLQQDTRWCWFLMPPEVPAD